MSGPIGIFDSGVGGLTVLRTLRAQFPNADFVYLGDTARVPYGTKSPETVSRYALNAAHYLLAQGCESLVIACNTASAYAADSLRASLDVPVIDMITPLAAHIARGPWRRVLVLGTSGTVESQAYIQALARAAPRVHTSQQACGLFCPLVEEGWLQGPVVQRVADHYFHAAFEAGIPDVIVLGCTHYPILHAVLDERVRALTGIKTIEMIDSSGPAAAALKTQLPLNTYSGNHGGTCRFLVTDAAERFVHLASRFLGETVHDVEHVDIPLPPT